jgi:hypothetical protein
MMRKKRAVVLIVLVGLLGLFIGALLGPRLHVLFWSAVLDWHPDVVVKNRACMRLGRSETGRDSLYNHLTSPNKVVRSLSVWTLASVESPDTAAFLFSRVPETNVDGRIDIVRGLSGFPLQYHWVLTVLRVELKNSKNSPRVKTEIAELLRSIKDAESGVLETHAVGEGGATAGEPGRVGDLRRDILNDSTYATAALTFSPHSPRDPDCRVWIQVCDRRRSDWPPVVRMQVGEGADGTLSLGSFTGRPGTEVFVYVNGQRPYVWLLRFHGRKAQVLYKLNSGRPVVYLRWNTREHACDIVEAWPTFQLGLDPGSRLSKAKTVLVVFRWDGHRYKYHHMEPGGAKLPDRGVG